MLNLVVRRRSKGPRAAADPPSAELASCGPVPAGRSASSGNESNGSISRSIGLGTGGIVVDIEVVSSSTRLDSSRTIVLSSRTSSSNSSSRERVAFAAAFTTPTAVGIDRLGSRSRRLLSLGSETI